MVFIIKLFSVLVEVSRLWFLVVFVGLKCMLFSGPVEFSYEKKPPSALSLLCYIAFPSTLCCLWNPFLSHHFQALCSCWRSLSYFTCKAEEFEIIWSKSCSKSVQGGGKGWLCSSQSTRPADHISFVQGVIFLIFSAVPVLGSCMSKLHTSLLTCSCPH